MKIICIGRNYVEHIEELGNERPKDPIIFMKPDTALLKKQRPILLSRFLRRHPSRNRTFDKNKERGKIN